MAPSPTTPRTISSGKFSNHLAWCAIHMGIGQPCSCGADTPCEFCGYTPVPGSTHLPDGCRPTPANGDFIVYAGSPVVQAPGAGVEAPLPAASALDRIAQSLEQLVALKYYELKFPLDTCRGADPSGLFADAHLALARELVQAAGGTSGDEGTTEKLASQLAAEGMTDPFFFDGVRRIATYLNIPFTDFDDLSALAKSHGWDKQPMTETLRGFGLLDE